MQTEIYYPDNSMNITDYPTPKSDAAEWMTELGTSVVCYDVSAQLEREAAAWKAVAEYAILRLRRAVMDDGKAMSMRSQSPVSLLKETQEAFDALKSQLTQP